MRRLVILLTLAVSACGAPRDSVQDFVANAGKGLTASIPDSPQPPEYRPAAYDAHDLRDPFAAPQRPERPRPADLSREPLEAYSLETLRMTGTVMKDGRVTALVRAPDGLLHRVQVGNRMGLNFGRITGITEAAITLVEPVLESTAQEMREVALNLADA